MATKSSSDKDTEVKTTTAPAEPETEKVAAEATEAPVQPKTEKWSVPPITEATLNYDEAAGHDRDSAARIEALGAALAHLDQMHGLGEVENKVRIVAVGALLDGDDEPLAVLLAMAKSLDRADDVQHVEAAIKALS